MSKEIKTITILGKRYKLRFVPNLGPNLGDCSDPNDKDRTIRIQSGLNEEDEKTVIIHECLHAADWSKDESWIDEVSRDISKILTRLGYKRSR